MKRVLVACEESQTVCKAFRERGFLAFSCDIQKCSGGHPEWHILGDVRDKLNGDCYFMTEDGVMHFIPGEWNLIIAHPPCTYLTVGGAVRLYHKDSEGISHIDPDRFQHGVAAQEFFMYILDSKCKHIAVENPTPMKIFNLPPYNQVIQPYQFGDPYSKRTCLWLKGLPPLKHTNVLDEYQPFINGGGGRLNRPNYKGKKFAAGSKNRSKTFPGIAAAMAEQWGNYLMKGE